MSRIPEPFGLWTPDREGWMKPLPSRDSVNHWPHPQRTRRRKPAPATLPPRTARRRAKKAAQAAKERQRE